MIKYLYVFILFLSFNTLKAQKNPKKIKSHKTYSKDNRVFTNDSIPLNGYYKIKYTDFLNDWKTDISYYKNGLKYGVSKILRFNKLEEKGTYVEGVKHGTWEKYYYFSGNLELTSEYKNGLKEGKEFGDTFEHGKFICNYKKNLKEGPLFSYNGYNGYLDYKEYYEKGEKIYKHSYDDFLNIIETQKFSDDINHVSITAIKRKNGNHILLDSIFYKSDNTIYNDKKIVFKIIKYRDNKLVVKRDVVIKKDSIRKGEYDRILIANSYDDKGKKTSALIFFNELLMDPFNLAYFKKSIIKQSLSPCKLFNLFVFSDFSKVIIYFKFDSDNTISFVSYNANNTSCNINIKGKHAPFLQSY